MQTETVKEFYKAAGKLGLETGLIVGTIYYTPAYKGVGYVYRTLGLNRLAFKCSTCVSYVLSSAHWFIRNIMVEKSSRVAEIIVNNLEKYIEVK